MGRSRTLADGQLSTSSATVISGADNGVPSESATVLLQNTSSSEETILLTFSRSGGTSRRLARIVLQENEQAIIRNLPMQIDDVLSGYTTTASTVDYLVFSGSGGGFSVEVYDALGTSKGVTTLRKVLLGIQHLVGDELPDPG